ncbi:MAG: D-tyrosyl-tRNA(Tyr) deacylase [bacterium]|nr:D-tyrosyl-tRNA(Tyr) deacylase [bacterium]
MRVVVQRVSRGQVTIDGKVVGKIGAGLVILLGVAEGDTEDNARFLADKCVNLRIFQDENDKMNLSLLDKGGEILSISQFTLYGDCRKGRRPSFIKAAEPEKGNYLYEKFNSFIAGHGVNVETGEFGAMMDVELVNAGPVTIIIDSKD